MIKLEKVQDVILKDYNVGVHPYLTLPQIDLIVNGVCSLESHDYSDRKMCEDMLILFHGTNLTKEELEEITYEDFVVSGLIESVRKEIKNIHLVKEALEYMESITRNLSILTPKIMPLLEKIGALNGKKTNN